MAWKVTQVFSENLLKKHTGANMLTKLKDFLSPKFHSSTQLLCLSPPAPPQPVMVLLASSFPSHFILSYLKTWDPLWALPEIASQ